MAAKVGLTGGIGSGKSAVAERFAGLGVRVVDADRIGRQLTEPGTAEFEAIVARFGDGILDTDGRIDRKQLGRMVFESPGQRAALEAILHPPIRARMTALAESDARAYCIMDIPLLVENRRHWQVARVVTVACDFERRIKRLRQSREMSEAEIKTVMATQASEAERRGLADDVIDNNGDIDALDAQVKKLHQNYLALFA